MDSLKSEIAAAAAETGIGKDVLEAMITKLLEEARTQAMKEAIAKAELYARASGLKVARIVSISEGYEYSTQPVMMQRAEMAMDAGAPTPIAAGEVGVTASVSVLFELVK